MSRILTTKLSSVQTPLVWSGIIFAVSVIMTLILWPTGLEHQLAQWVYAPQSDWAWTIRQYGAVPSMVVTLVAVLFLLSPWRKKYPAGRYLAVVWLLTALIGAALLNQVLLNELVDRARPRESVLAADGGKALLSGHSFPSGHAAVGFVFVAPFFLWWRQNRRRLALAALAVGMAAGFGIGFARMVVGAHFLTDVLWAGTLCLLAAIWAPVLYQNKRDVPLKLTAGLLLVAAFCVVWFNSFKLTLQWQAPAPMTEIFVDIPVCSGLLVVVGGVTKPEATLHLKGYGAPLSNLILDNNANHLFLQHWRGLYRGLRCDGLTLTVPAGTKVRQSS